MRWQRIGYVAFYEAATISPASGYDGSIRPDRPSILLRSSGKLAGVSSEDGKGLSHRCVPSTKQRQNSLASACSSWGTWRLITPFYEAAADSLASDRDRAVLEHLVATSTKQLAGVRTLGPTTA